MQRCYSKVPHRLWLSPLGILYILALHVTPVMLHPQCLDFKPPFRPLRELEFCVMYKEFGCCDYQKDQELMTKFYEIMDNFDSYGYGSCAGFVLELLCQVGMHKQRSLPCFNGVIFWGNRKTPKFTPSTLINWIKVKGHSSLTNVKH